jgi:gliding motility-associated-like protein
VIDSVTIVDYIQVNVFHPIAAFTSNYTIPIYTGDSIHFQDQSYDLYGTIALWQWWFGDGTGSNFLNPAHEWNLPGMYQVTLIVTDNKGCKDSTYYDFIDVIEGIIEIPNIFSPNNDGYNDFFEIKASGIETFQLEIFNRWGMKLFTSNSINIMWDGYNQSGLQCPDGTYYYVLKATGYTGTAYNRAGFVMLLR